MDTDHDDMDHVESQLEEPTSSSSPIRYGHFKKSDEKKKLKYQETPNTPFFKCEEQPETPGVFQVSQGKFELPSILTQQNCMQ